VTGGALVAAVAPRRPLGLSAKLPRYVPVCVNRTFLVARRDPFGPVRTQTSSAPFVSTAKTA